MEVITKYRYALYKGEPIVEETRYILAGTLNNNMNDPRNVTAKQAGIDEIDSNKLVFKHIIVNNLADGSQSDLPEWYANQDDLKLMDGVSLISEQEYNDLIAKARQSVEDARLAAIKKIGGL